MNEEFVAGEVPKKAALTTAALAGVGQQTAASGISAAGVAPALEAVPLLSTDEVQDFRARWDAIQVSFVDEPRKSVEQADSLVAGAMKRLAEMFADERARLEGQWDRGGNVSTEDLRIALRRYRSFFLRLLSV